VIKGIKTDKRGFKDKNNKKEESPRYATKPHPHPNQIHQLQFCFYQPLSVFIPLITVTPLIRVPPRKSAVAHRSPQSKRPIS
jgi:hypothetical protein